MFNKTFAIVSYCVRQYIKILVKIFFCVLYLAFLEKHFDACDIHAYL